MRCPHIPFLTSPLVPQKGKNSQAHLQLDSIRSVSRFDIDDEYRQRIDELAEQPKEEFLR